jgi:hypothetical protein
VKVSDATGFQEPELVEGRGIGDFLRGAGRFVGRAAGFGGKVVPRGGLGANLLRILAWPEPAY